MSSFFFGDVAHAIFLDFFGGSNEDGRATLTGHPETFTGLSIEREESGKVGFHGLIFFERECHDEEKESNWKWNDSE